MSTKTPPFWEKMAEKMEVKVAIPPSEKLHFWATHCRFSFFACATIKSYKTITINCYPKSDYSYLYKTQMYGQWFKLPWIKRKQRTKMNKTFHSVLLRNVIFFRVGRQLWPPFSQAFFPKLGMFLCSLDWKFPEFSKTHPTFVCSPFLGGAIGI